MSGTYLQIGGDSTGTGSGGGGSNYWKDPVANFAALPTGDAAGTIRVTLDTGALYFYDGLTWVNEDAGEVPNSRVINTTAPLTGGGNLGSDKTIAIPAATNSVDGYLTSADHTTFAAKVGATRAINTTAPITGGGDLSADRTLAMAAATGSVDGYLTSGNFTTFNNKEPAVTAGTTAQYYRGDKSFQALNTDAITTIVDGTVPVDPNMFAEQYDGTFTLDTANTPATGVWGSVASVLVPAGRWYLGGLLTIKDNGSDLSAVVQVTVSEVASPSPVVGEYVSAAFLTTGDQPFTVFMPYRVFSFAIATLVYVNVRSFYTTGTPQTAGQIMGWRV